MLSAALAPCRDECKIVGDTGDAGAIRLAESASIDELLALFADVY